MDEAVFTPEGGARLLCRTKWPVASRQNSQRARDEGLADWRAVVEEDRVRTRGARRWSRGDVLRKQSQPTFTSLAHHRCMMTRPSLIHRSVALERQNQWSQCGNIAETIADPDGVASSDPEITTDLLRRAPGGSIRPARNSLALLGAAGTVS